MSYLEMSEEEIHNLVERGGLDDDMFFSLHTEALEKIKELDVWSRFAGYLLDHCEGETIWEENLQFWLSDMIKLEKEKPE